MYALKNNLREYKSKYILMRPNKYKSELRVASTWADHFSELSTVISSSLALSESGIEVSPIGRLNLPWFKVGCLWTVETSMVFVMKKRLQSTSYGTMQKTVFVTHECTIPFTNEHQMFPLSSMGTCQVVVAPESLSLACSVWWNNRNHFDGIPKEYLSGIHWYVCFWK